MQLTIPRDTFKAAIEAGIEASPTLLDREREALREVGRDALRVGTIYSTGCPAAQAGLCPFPDEVTDRAADFASAFDDFMQPQFGLMEYATAKTIRVL